MQMDIERFRDTHKLIWDIVLANVDEIKKGKMNIDSIKLLGVRVAYSVGLLDRDEMELIIEHHSCMLCASHTSCMNCILGSCHTVDSLYARAIRGDAAAMKEIRDVVDKQPFTDLFTIDLHE